MTYETILHDVKDGIVRITINQAEKMNRLSNRVLKEVIQAMDSLSTAADAPPGLSRPTQAARRTGLADRVRRRVLARFGRRGTPNRRS